MVEPKLDARMQAKAANQALKCEINKRIAFAPSKKLNSVNQ
jgi:hypothetical protein